ncbi:uncharacterized protein MEPE_00914 [Melanopsichium pennsylvanicum]|uniref:Uncharacterized protein n=1 Tax=Melanopsichium pennsylvanicum TaxID=63383 RepID=A0AAJ4XJF2_9BASI|nr:uncharacterized protein MEPE_00914 [Melanopsichium pennsylvanicum]
MARIESGQHSSSPSPQKSDDYDEKSQVGLNVRTWQSSSGPTCRLLQGATRLKTFYSSSAAVHKCPVPVFNVLQMAQIHNCSSTIDPLS